MADWMTDIVVDLRDCAANAEGEPCVLHACAKAADEIERLRAVLDNIRKCNDCDGHYRVARAFETSVIANKEQ